MKAVVSCFPLLTALCALEPAHARHSKNKFFLCSRLLAAFSFPLSAFSFPLSAFSFLLLSLIGKLHEIRLDETVNLAVHYTAYIRCLVVCTVVLHATVIEDVAADL